MIRTTAWLVASMLALSGAQEDSKEEKEKAKQAEAAARKVLDAYRADMSKATTPGAAVMAVMNHLHGATPHPLIRATLASVLKGHPFVDAQMVAADCLGKYKKDREAAQILLLSAKAHPKVPDLQRKCLQRFGAVSPYGMAGELVPWFGDANPDVAREAIEASVAVNSVRLIPPLIELLGELESISEDKIKRSFIQEPPLPGAPGGTPMDTTNKKIFRKKRLTDPTRKAINILWKKVDPKSVKLSFYKDASAALAQYRNDLLKVQEAEDLEDRGAKPSDKDPKKDSK